MPEQDYLELKRELAELKQLLLEIQAVQTGKLYQPKARKKSQKQLKNEHLEELRRTAHLRVLNKS